MPGFVPPTHTRSPIIKLSVSSVNTTLLSNQRFTIIITFLRINASYFIKAIAKLRKALAWCTTIQLSTFSSGRVAVKSFDMNQLFFQIVGIIISAKLKTIFSIEMRHVLDSWDLPDPLRRPASLNLRPCVSQRCSIFKSGHANKNTQCYDSCDGSCLQWNSWMMWLDSINETLLSMINFLLRYLRQK